MLPTHQDEFSCRSFGITPCQSEMILLLKCAIINSSPKYPLKFVQCSLKLVSLIRSWGILIFAIGNESEAIGEGQSNKTNFEQRYHKINVKFIKRSVI